MHLSDTLSKIRDFLLLICTWKCVSSVQTNWLNYVISFSLVAYLFYYDPCKPLYSVVMYCFLRDEVKSYRNLLTPSNRGFFVLGLFQFTFWMNSFAFPWNNNLFSYLELTFVLREVNSFSISALRSSSLSLTVLNSLKRLLEVPDL